MNMKYCSDCNKINLNIHKNLAKEKFFNLMFFKLIAKSESKNEKYAVLTTYHFRTCTIEAIDDRLNSTTLIGI